MNKNKIILPIILGTTTLVSCTITEDKVIIEDVDRLDSIEESNKMPTEETVLSEEESKNYEIDILLVNEENVLDENYVPENLVTLNIPFDGSAESKKMVEEAAIKVEEMFEAAKKDGITLIGKSGYRSYKTQEVNYNTKVNTLGKTEADKFVAKPGKSEHQTGLAIDIVSSDFKKLHTKFQHTDAYKWLLDNCADYGFILRYPKGKSEITGYSFEPWHYRYVGVEYAKEIMANGITLEEYLGK